MVVPLSALPAVGLAEGHEGCAVLCGDGNRMRTAEDDLVPQPRMQRIGLAWSCRLTREPRRLARRYLLQGPMNLVRAVRAQLICYPGVYYAGTPISEHAQIPDAARDPTPPKPATASANQHDHASQPKRPCACHRAQPKRPCAYHRALGAAARGKDRSALAAPVFGPSAYH